MNFTREPIIETIISPKEGYKLSLRNSKIGSAEEVSVDAVEIVSFGQALFYRSLEKNKCFLLPVTDYEVMEVRETRLVIKNASFEKNIKIGGGRDHVRSSKEVITVEKNEAASEEKNATEAQDNQGDITPSHTESRNDRKRDRRRNRRKRMQEERPESKASPTPEVTSEANSAEENTGIKEEAPKERGKPNLNVFTGLIPPPPTLISETIAKYKERGDIVEKPRHASSEQAPVSSVQLEEFSETAHSADQTTEDYPEENLE